VQDALSRAKTRTPFLKRSGEIAAMAQIIREQRDLITRILDKPIYSEPYGWDEVVASMADEDSAEGPRPDSVVFCHKCDAKMKWVFFSEKPFDVADDVWQGWLAADLRAVSGLGPDPVYEHELRGLAMAETYSVFQCIDPNVFVLSDDDEGEIARVVIKPAFYDLPDEEKAKIAVKEFLAQYPDMAVED
jgi:hypothetical protein